jgi:hypothetical protein
MKLLQKSELKISTQKQEQNTIMQGVRISKLIDDQIKKLNHINDEFEKQKKVIEEKYRELFDSRLKELVKLQNKKDSLLLEIKDLENKR